MKAVRYTIIANEIIKDAGKEGNDTAKRLADLFSDFVFESGQLMKKRGDTYNAVSGVVKETEAKWRAICKRAPGLNPNGYANWVMMKMPEQFLFLKESGCFPEFKLESRLIPTNEPVQ